ncbi:MAG: hypothetical protein KatS3mg061_1318 [Dehalococcoidia bacterium]|nr:MAG: hypothetical protein KatS3mg061_1318 [Dehalococcoidia bacterium]
MARPRPPISSGGSSPRAGQPTGLVNTVRIVTGRARPNETNLTTPDAITIQALLAEMVAAGGCQRAVLEASSHALDQRRLDGVAFATALCTNLAPEHLNYHGTLERYIAAKSRLFSLLVPGGIAVRNADNPLSDQLTIPPDRRVLTFGLERGGSPVPRRLRSLPRGAAFGWSPLLAESCSPPRWSGPLQRRELARRGSSRGGRRAAARGHRPGRNNGSPCARPAGGSPCWPAISGRGGLCAYAASACRCAAGAAAVDHGAAGCRLWARGRARCRQPAPDGGG